MSEGSNMLEQEGSNTEPELSDKEDDVLESPAKKIKLDDNGSEEVAANIQEGDDSNADSLKVSAVNEDNTESPTKSVYEMFTHFDYLEEDQPQNVGTFGVLSCAYVPYGERPGLSAPVTNFVLMDGEKKKGLFTIYGNNAMNWKDTNPDEVVHLENFSWRKDYREKSHFYDVNMDHCGFMTDATVLEVIPHLSKQFREQRAEEINHVFSSVEMQQHCDRIVLVLKSKLPETTGRRRQDNSLLHMRPCMFSTSDDIPVKITAFESRKDVFDSLEEQKVYVIENLHIPPQSNYTLSHVCFNVGNNTTFKLTNVKLETVKEKEKVVPPTETVKATLKDLVNADPSFVYESDVIVRQRSVNGTDVMVFDFDEERETQLSAIMKFTDNITLERGQRLHIKYKAIKNWDTKDLIVEKGSIKLLPEMLNFPVDKIDILRFKRI